MIPFADPPPGQPRDGMLPFSVSVGLWTIFNFIVLARIAHVLAGLILPSDLKWRRRWWYARTVPVYVAIGGLFYSIGFGQVNIIVLGLLVEMLRARISGASLQSGCWLAAAIVLKVFPAYLLLYPLLLRDKKAGVGVVMGLVVGLGVVPIVGLGLDRTIAANASFVQRVLLPGALGTGNPDELKELLNPGVNDNQAILAVIHNDVHPDQLNKPASKFERLLHYTIAFVLTAMSCFVGWRNGLRTAASQIIFVGSLMVLMVHISPMSHMHYYAYDLVLVAGIWLTGLSRSGNVQPTWNYTLPLAIWGIGTGLPLFPGPFFEILRFHGLGLFCSIMLWIVGMRLLSSEKTGPMTVSLPAEAGVEDDMRSIEARRGLTTAKA